jgi:hypothetical protein
MYMLIVTLHVCCIATVLNKERAMKRWIGIKFPFLTVFALIRSQEDIMGVTAVANRRQAVHTDLGS